MSSDDARQDFDPQSGNPVVSIRFNNAGGRKFGRVTAENVGKPFAIILDNVVISAPNINEPILGGSAQISGNFTVESGNELAISLRSGKLPVALKVIEESSVSAELGQDSIEKGVLAGTRTEFDVMKNLNQLTQVQLDLTRSRYELISAWFRLKSYLGSVDNQFVDELSSIFSS